MRAVIQRVSQADVEVDGRTTGSIEQGLLVLLGVHTLDKDSDVIWMVEKIINLRIFDDDAGKLNRSLLDIAGSMLVVPQFTLFGDCRKGRRPSWGKAAKPDSGQRLYQAFVEASRAQGIVTQTGIFRAMMHVSLINDGPVTLLLDSHKTF